MIRKTKLNPLKKKQLIPSDFNLTKDSKNKIEIKQTFEEILLSSNTDDIHIKNYRSKNLQNLKILKEIVENFEEGFFTVNRDMNWSEVFNEFSKKVKKLSENFNTYEKIEDNYRNHIYPILYANEDKKNYDCKFIGKPLKITKEEYSENLNCIKNGMSQDYPLLLKDFCVVYKIDENNFDFNTMAKILGKTKLDIITQNNYEELKNIGFQIKNEKMSQKSIAKSLTLLEFIKNTSNKETKIANDIDMLIFKKILQDLQSKIPSNISFNSKNDWLTFLRNHIRGVTEPQINILSKGAWIGGHQEPLNLKAIYLNHGPESNEWCVIPRNYVIPARNLIRTVFDLDILTCEGLWLGDEHFFRSNGIEVLNFTQNKGDAVILNRGSLFWVKAKGITINSSWNLIGQDYDQIGEMIKRYKINEHINFGNIINMKVLGVDLLLNVFLTGKTKFDPAGLQNAKILIDSLSKFFEDEEIYKNSLLSDLKIDEISNVDINVLDCDNCSMEIFNYFGCCSKCKGWKSNNLCLACFKKHFNECQNKNQLTLFSNWNFQEINNFLKTLYKITDKKNLEFSKDIILKTDKFIKSHFYIRNKNSFFQEKTIDDDDDEIIKIAEKPKKQIKKSNNNEDIINLVGNDKKSKKITEINKKNEIKEENILLKIEVPDQEEKKEKIIEKTKKNTNKRTHKELSKIELKEKSLEKTNKITNPEEINEKIIEKTKKKANKRIQKELSKIELKENSSKKTNKIIQKPKLDISLGKKTSKKIPLKEENQKNSIKKKKNSQLDLLLKEANLISNDKTLKTRSKKRKNISEIYEIISPMKEKNNSSIIEIVEPIKIQSKKSKKIFEKNEKKDKMIKNSLSKNINNIDQNFDKNSKNIEELKKPIEVKIPESLAVENDSLDKNKKKNIKSKEKLKLKEKSKEKPRNKPIEFTIPESISQETDSRNNNLKKPEKSQENIRLNKKSKEKLKKKPQEKQNEQSKEKLKENSRINLKKNNLKENKKEDKIDNKSLIENQAKKKLEIPIEIENDESYQPKRLKRKAIEKLNEEKIIKKTPIIKNTFSIEPYDKPTIIKRTEQEIEEMRKEYEEQLAHNLSESEEKMIKLREINNKKDDISIASKPKKNNFLEKILEEKEKEEYIDEVDLEIKMKNNILKNNQLSKLVQSNNTFSSRKQNEYLVKGNEEKIENLDEKIKDLKEFVLVLKNLPNINDYQLLRLDSKIDILKGSFDKLKEKEDYKIIKEIYENIKIDSQLKKPLEIFFN